MRTALASSDLCMGRRAYHYKQTKEVSVKILDYHRSSRGCSIRKVRTNRNDHNVYTDMQIGQLRVTQRSAVGWPTLRR